MMVTLKFRKLDVDPSGFDIDPDDFDGPTLDLDPADVVGSSGHVRSITRQSLVEIDRPPPATADAAGATEPDAGEQLSFPRIKLARRRPMTCAAAALALIVAGLAGYISTTVLFLR